MFSGRTSLAGASAPFAETIRVKLLLENNCGIRNERLDPFDRVFRFLIRKITSATSNFRMSSSIPVQLFESCRPGFYSNCLVMMGNARTFVPVHVKRFFPFLDYGYFYFAD